MSPETGHLGGRERKEEGGRGEDWCPGTAGAWGLQGVPAADSMGWSGCKGLELSENHHYLETQEASSLGAWGELGAQRLQTD